jgi:aflatoxin B1 aldehyde reductase
MTFGEEGKEGARVHDSKDIEAILDIFQAHGHDEVSDYQSAPSFTYFFFRKVDAARTYCGGTCEEYLGKVDWKRRGLKMETKLSPRAVSGVRMCMPLPFV